MNLISGKFQIFENELTENIFDESANKDECTVSWQHALFM